jgi:uncharacterized protein YndB with AHSA1/START domain
MTKNNPTKITAEPGKQEIIIEREFDAPRELVFKAFTDPKLYVQWLGPRGLTTKLETFEPRNGGSWRYIQKDQNGNEFAFHGVNHEVNAPERIIGTFEFEGLPKKGHVILQQQDLLQCLATGQSLRHNPSSSRLPIVMVCSSLAWKWASMIRMIASTSFWKY